MPGQCKHHLQQLQVVKKHIHYFEQYRRKFKQKNLGEVVQWLNTSFEKSKQPSIKNAPKNKFLIQV